MTEKQIIKYFNQAKNASEFSDYTKKNIHIGSVIVYKNKVIAVGYNMDKTNPLQYQYNKYREYRQNKKAKHNKEDRLYFADSHLPCVHAEMKCLIDTKDLNIDWKKATMFIYRESCGKTRMCRCCPSCMKAIKDRGIKNIYYTTEQGYVNEVIN